ncbi:tetratricopeptide repeat protein [Maribellus comscasis]|uniref:Tetratricopeptide repeat protein n=1 Tax=Maribellus comscasis TaxID=2681766 RepID=A0A6I6K212_9BACT|nr:SMI1/KNR4 family protein [Maribellus comscasis]QGY47498.1 tetratricopeptide repeat protein [Maribellus comscasis]
MPGNCMHFSSPANELKINIFERINQVQLPDSFKKFLLEYNGGMMLYDYQADFIQTQADFDLYKKESVYLLSIEEITEKYANMVSLAVQRGNNIHPYPFIPFCTLPDKSFLSFVSLSDSHTESPVFIGTHRQSEKLWNWVSSGFPDFLKHYMDKNGHPEFSDTDVNKNAHHFFNALGVGEEIRKGANSLNSLSAKERARYYYEQALQHNKSDKYFESWELISKAINEESNNAFYYFFRAEILNLTKQFRAALIDYDSALKLEPENSFYWCCRAEVFIQLKKLNRALEDCSQALQIDPKNTLAYFLRKQVYLKMGNLELAEKDQQKIDELEKIE